MIKRLTVIMVLVCSMASADFVVQYNKNTGVIKRFHHASTTMSGLKSPWALGTTVVATGSETNISQIPDLKPVKTKDELILDALDVVLDSTKTKQEKQAAVAKARGKKRK